MVAVSSAEVRAAIAAGRYEDILDRILEAHARLAESADVIICEGVDSMQAFPALESDINIDIARNINAATLLLTGARGRHAGAVIDDIRLVRKKLEERGAQVFGVVINRVDPTHHGDFADEARRLLKKEGLQLYGVLPEIMQLSSPRVADVVRELGAEVLVGEHHLETRFGRALVAAMGLENALHYMEESALVITPGDREEILLAAAAAHAAENVPRPSGVVLTGGFEPRRKVMQLVRALSGGRLPILRVDTPTYETTIAVSAIQSSLEEGQDDKALAIREAMEEYINVDALMQERFAPTERVLTPKRFLRDLRDKARADKKTIVLPEGNVDRILKATEALRRQDIANIVLVGDDGEVRRYAGQLGVTLDDGVEIVNPLTDAAFDDYVDTLVELRKHKGLPKDMAQDLMRDRNYFGTMMVYKGRADGLVSGSTTTTQATLRPAFEFVRAREGFKHVSSVFFMCLPDRVLVYADCAVIPNPTTEQLAEIALASADTAAAFGIEPRVAMLSYSTGASGKGEDVDTVRAATALVRERNPTLKVEGPIQYDAAVDPGVARTKLPDSDVAGRATVFIFPDLNTGNNTYKAVQRTAGAIAIGPVLQGMRKPVNDLSRGATITDIVNTAIVTAIQAQAE
jgi:phosphate acetyltransferase